jgi:hypothetical protein
MVMKKQTKEKTLEQYVDEIKKKYETDSAFRELLRQVFKKSWR